MADALKVKPEQRRERSGQTDFQETVKYEGETSDSIGRLKELREECAQQLARIDRLERLLSFESQVRGVETLRELWFCAANEALHFTQAKQILVCKKLPQKKLKIQIFQKPL